MRKRKSNQSKFISGRPKTYLPLRLQVQLVGDENQRNVLGESDACDQFPVLGRLLEAVPVGHGVADDESLAAAHVLVAHRRELHLAGGVEDVEKRRLAVDDRLLLIGVLCEGEPAPRISCRLNPRTRNAKGYLPMVGSW